MSYSVQYFLRTFGFYLQYTWNSDNEQWQKEMLTLYRTSSYQNTQISLTYLSELSLLISHQME